MKYQVHCNHFGAGSRHNVLQSNRDIENNNAMKIMIMIMTLNDFFPLSFQRYFFTISCILSKHIICSLVQCVSFR